MRGTSMGGDGREGGDARLERVRAGRGGKR